MQTIKMYALLEGKSVILDRVFDSWDEAVSTAKYMTHCGRTISIAHVTMTIWETTEIKPEEELLQ